jgi:hypothetical protein
MMVMMVMMLMMHDKRVNVLNFFSFSGIPLDLLLWAARLCPDYKYRTTPPPIFFFFNDGTALPSRLSSRLSRYCRIFIQSRLFCAAGAPEPASERAQLRAFHQNILQ